MKNLIFGIFLATELIAANAFAGPITSGGGFAVVCRTSNDEIITAQLLDLYEAKNKFNYTLIPSTGSLEGDYVASVQNTYRLQAHEDMLIDSSVRKNLDKFLDNVIFLGKNQPLPNLYDLGNHLNAPIGCEIEPLAIWFDNSDTIKIKSEIWEKLSTLDQAALVQHELSYHYDRGLYEKTSEGARAFVATIFSQNATPVLDEKSKALPWGMAVSIDPLTAKKTYTSFTYQFEGQIMTLNLFTIMDRLLVSKAIAQINLAGTTLRQSIDETNHKLIVISETDKIKKIRSHIETNQSNAWDIEFTLIPNKQVKIGFYQKGILIQESFLINL